MTVMNKTVHVGDIGVRITATIKESGTAVDISAYGKKEFHLKQPNGSVTTISATFVTTGSDGAIYFDSTSTTFDVDGDYKLEAYLVNTAASKTFHTDTFHFEALGNLG